MSLYIDLSEFLKNPITTGIQRIEGEICRYLPSDAAIPVRHHLGRYVALPPELISTIGRHFRDPSEAGVKEIRRLGAAESSSPKKVLPRNTFLAPEVIIEQQRLAFLDRMDDSEFQRHRF